MRRWLLLTVLLGGCIETLPDGDLDAAVPRSCNIGLGLGGAGASFGDSMDFVCPGGRGTPPAEDGGLPSLDATLVHADHRNIACIYPFFAFSGDAWHVAIGAPFALESDGSSVVPAQPAAPLATAVPGGWTLTEPIYLGFVASRDGAVVDFTHVVGEPLATMQWLFQVGAGVIAPFSLDASTSTSISASIGADVTIVVMPTGADGAALAGAIDCTFASEDPAVMTITGDGIVATGHVRRAGTVTLSATCMGVTSRANVFVSAAPPDGGDDPAGDPDGAGNDADTGAGDVETDALFVDDAAADGGLEGGY